MVHKSYVHADNNKVNYLDPQTTEAEQNSLFPVSGGRLCQVRVKEFTTQCG